MIYRANLKQEGNKVAVVEPVRNTQVIQSVPKEKSQSRVNKKMIFMLLGIFVVVFVAAFFYDRLASYRSRVSILDENGNEVATCDNILNPKCWTEAFKPNLKQSNGYTSALVVGVDTRRGTSSLMNTDSIMQVIFKHDTQEIMMVSIPRDFWSTGYNTKINAVYAITYKKGQNEKQDAFYYLKEEVSKVTGYPIQYTALIKLDGVIDLVDKIGGVEVCVDQAFTAKYPNDDAKINKLGGWFYYDFPKGCQQLDGNMALVYSRFRYITKGPSYLASDFSRAHRQQEIIGAIKDKMLSDNVPLEQKAETYWGLFQSMGDTISIDISLEDMLAALYYLNTFDRVPVEIVLDPNFGGLNKFIYTDSSTGLYTIKPKDKSYKALNAEISKIYLYSGFYKESPNILVRNQSGDKTLAADHVVEKLRKETAYYSAFNTINEAKTDKFYGIKVFDFTAGAKPKSLEIIKQFIPIEQVEELPEKYGITRSNKNEDFLIVVGPIEPTPTATTEVTPTE